MRKELLLIPILLLAIFFRFLWIDKIPHSVNTDELHYLLSAKAFYLTGKDLSQTVTPLNILTFNYPKDELVQSELPYFLEMFTVGPEPFSMTGNALPNVVLSVLIVLMLYLIAKRLLNETVGLLAGFIAAINPWFISSGRTSYETVPATLFFLCALYVLLIAKGWKILLAFPFLVLAFYSYIGTKLIFLPVVILSVLYAYFFVHKRQFVKQYVILFGLSFLFVLFYIYQITHVPSASRLSEIVLPNSSAISQKVDFLRKTTLANPLLPLVSNKMTVFFSILTINTLNIFSFDYLFIHGDYFSFLGQQGLFYPIDIIFLLIGSAWIFLHKRKLFVFFVLCIVLGIIPQIFHDPKGEGNFTPHIMFIFPFLMIFIAVGIWQLVESLHGKLRLASIIFIGFSYFLFTVTFANFYFFHLPLQHDFYNITDRVLARYVVLSKSQQQHVIIYSPHSLEKFKKYLFYSNGYNKDNTSQIADALHDGNYTLADVAFRSCGEVGKNINKKDLLIIDAECEKSLKGPHLTIPQLSDSGGVYAVYNDTVCGKYGLKPYVSDFYLSDFTPEKYDNQTFCTRLLSQI